MTNFDAFLKNNEPAYGETEKQYFLRLAEEYKLQEKAEAKALRKQLWIKRFNSVTKLLAVEPNLNMLRPNILFHYRGL
ncbi:MAG: hypothetical protein V7731_08470 [Amphritea sp.]